MIADFVAVMLGAASIFTGGPPPAGPPTSPNATPSGNFGGTTTYDFTWVSGDLTAYTRVYVNSVLVHTAGIGVQSWPNSNYPYDEEGGTETFTFKHYKSGVESVGADLPVTNVGAPL